MTSSERLKTFSLRSGGSLTPTLSYTLVHSPTVQSLKLVSAIFYQIFIISLNDSPSKIIKIVFYFIEKTLFVLTIFKFLYFFSFLSTLCRFKKTNKKGIIYDVMNWLA